MYSKLENRLKLAHSSSDSLSRDIKTTREVFKRKIVEYKSSFDRLNALLLLSDPEETPLTQKLRIRVRELVAKNKRLQKTASSLRSRIRLHKMDPETLICMLEGLDAEELDSGKPDPASSQILLIPLHHTGPPVVFESGDDCSAGEESKISSPPAAISSSSRAASTSSLSATPSQRRSSGKSGKRKATRSQHGDDDQNVDLGDGSEDVDMEVGRECSATPSSVSAGFSPPKKQRVLYLPHGGTVTPPAKSKPVASPFGETPISASTKAGPITPVEDTPPSSRIRRLSDHKRSASTVSAASSKSSPRLTPQKRRLVSSAG
ncbi:putative membrane protein [Phytophthora megakarya]|uniref:Putative membrane protein n=1 Tax=Phytophthora megakarya TaxID=4795 RepID=A0A225WFP9_9STRA|nr:putative membrane protein [Phytophthora megakarya]